MLRLKFNTAGIYSNSLEKDAARFADGISGLFRMKQNHGDRIFLPTTTL